MLEGMPRQGGVVHLYIQFEILVKSVMPEKSDHGFSIIIILVLAGFHGFWFDQEGPVKSLFSSVVTGH